MMPAKVSPNESMESIKLTMVIKLILVLLNIMDIVPVFIVVLRKNWGQSELFYRRLDEIGSLAIQSSSFWGRRKFIHEGLRRHPCLRYP